MSRKSFVIAVLLFLLPASAIAQGRPPSQITELLDLEFYFPPEVDEWYQQHRQDLSDPARSWVLTSVYAGPRKDATIIGDLTAEARWSDARQLEIVLGYRPAQEDTTVIWREQLGDWDYGIHQFVLQRRARWGRLPPEPFGDSAWLLTQGQTGNEGLIGRITSLEQRLVEVDAMQALNVRTGNRTTIDRQVYFVTRVDNRSVEFRPELPSDMPCGARDDGSGRIAEKPDGRSLYRVPLQQMMTKEGKPRFEVEVRPRS